MFVVRDWMNCNCTRFEDREEACTAYKILVDSLLAEGAECDVQVYEILMEHNNVD